LAARSVYLATADVLRGGSSVDRETRHRHTPLSEAFRYGVIDSEIRAQYRLSSMIAWAAMHGRDDVKLDDAGSSYSKIYFDALAVIPYLTGGTSFEEKQALDIEKIREEYEAFRRSRGEIP